MIFRGAVRRGGESHCAQKPHDTRTHTDLHSPTLLAPSLFNFLCLQTLLKNTSLRELDIRDCSIGVIGSSKIARALATNSGLETLKLAGNNLHQSGGMAIADALLSNHRSKLKILDLSFTRITPECVNALSVHAHKVSVNYSGNKEAEALGYGTLLLA